MEISTNVYLSLGSNSGNREQTLINALEQLKILVGPITSQSSIYETEPWGFDCKQHFLNMVIGIETYLTSSKLLDVILNIETHLGRVRSQERYSSRTIDIDILFYKNEVVDNEQLTIPHPQIQNRHFVLVPLAEIAANFTHPTLKKSVQQLLMECADNKSIKKL